MLQRLTSKRWTTLKEEEGNTVPFFVLAISAILKVKVKRHLGFVTNKADAPQNQI